MNQIEQQYTIRQKQTNREILLNQYQHSSDKQKLQQQLKEQIFSIIRDKSIQSIQYNSKAKLRQKLIGFYDKIDLIRPENPTIILWNILLILIILYFIIEIPLLVGYGETVWSQQTENLLIIYILFIIILILDIFIAPLKMYYDRGLLINDKEFLLRRYYKRYFWIDILGLLAVLIPTILNQYFFINFAKIFFIPKIITIQYLNKRIMQTLVFQNKLKLIYQIARIVIFIYIVAHYLGIGFYILGYYIYSTNYYGPNTPNICWIYNSQAYSQMVINLDWKGQYLYTMYFSIGVTTTIAYGDITPLNPLQTLYIIFVLIINTLVFGYILSDLLRILIEAFYSNFQKKKARFTMESLLKNKKITKKLQILIRTHLEQIQIQQKYRNRQKQKQVIQNLPLNFKINLYSQIYNNFITQLNIFPYFNSNFKSKQSISSTRFIQKILFNIVQTRYLAGDILYKQNQIYSEEMKNHKAYYIKDRRNIDMIMFGVGKIPQVDLQSNKIIQKPQQQKLIYFPNHKQLFGNIQFFTGQNRSHWCLSTASMVLYELSRLSIFQNLPSTNKKQFQHLILSKQLSPSSYCLICQQSSHNFTQCNKCHFIPDIIQSIEHLNERQKANRKIDEKIYLMRIQKRIISNKTNALRNYKKLFTSNEKKMLQKSKIKMLAHSKHYRKMYHNHRRNITKNNHNININNDNNINNNISNNINNQLNNSSLFLSDQHQQTFSDTSSQSSNCSSQDLDYLICQTKLLIQNLNSEQSSNNKIYYQPFFNYQFDQYYNYQIYKIQCNYQNVIKKYNNRIGSYEEDKFIRNNQIREAFEKKKRKQI